MEDSEQMFIYEITYSKTEDKCNAIFHLDFQHCWKDIMENSYKEEIVIDMPIGENHAH